VQPLASQERALPRTSGETACPLELLKFNPSPVKVTVKNVSGKKVVGLVFEVALADSAEHWKWLHWDYDEQRPLRDFGWNKPISPSETKKLSWSNWSSLDFEHGGGGAFVLTSVLFEDGSSWEEPIGSASCKYINTSGTPIIRNRLSNRWFYHRVGKGQTSLTVVKSPYRERRAMKPLSRNCAGVS
jgi:hypothetical protein